MTSVTSAIESLVLSLVPHARNDDALKRELVDHCHQVLSSHIGQSHEQDIGHLADLVKRQLLRQNPNGASSLRFTNLLSRLLDQPVLSKKYASILFLHSLASSSRAHPPNASFLPSIAPPPRATPAPHTPLEPISIPEQPAGKTKAQTLREYQAQRGRPQIPEHLLLRDTLYLLQGISGKYARFKGKEDPQLTFVEDGKYTISAPTKALVHRLSEVGYLYSRVEAFVNQRERFVGVGMIEQSLCHHLEAQLTDYYRLIAILESQMSSTKLENPIPKDAETGLTLKRLDVWITDWRLRMRLMSVCVEGAKDAHGGALVNLIHSYTGTGDPFIRHFTDQLLEEVSKPFFATLHKWLFSGELHDPFNEFFVAVDPALEHLQFIHQNNLSGGAASFGDDPDDIANEQETGLRLWEAKYQFQKEMLPMFVGEAFGKKIFSTGKSLNFIRYSCHDSDWVATREKMSSTGGVLKYSDIAGLERSIDAAYQVASQRLFEVFIDKFKLLDHLLAFKNYLMLSHGDFTEQLMEAIGPSLARPANTLYRHNLTATLETAIRSSNAQNDPTDVLRRLDARMHEYSHGEIGWDVFTLEYKVDAPIDTVLDPDAMVQYQRVFKHMWQMKRVEVAVSKGWMRIAGGSRTFLRLPELEYDWHRIRLVMAEMIHFVRQLHAYCHLEVIECQWKVLDEFLTKKEGDLDALINAHRAYLSRVVKKILLLSPKTGKEENVLTLVREAFFTILQFRETCDNFYNYCLAESARRDRQMDIQRGVYTGSEEINAQNPEILPKIRRRIEEYSTTFADKTQSIVHSLQSHADLDCRFLAIRLSFSDYYKSKKETHGHAKS